MAKKLKKKLIIYGIIIFSVITLFSALIMWNEVSIIEDYNGGQSYVNYSPDGKYKLDMVYKPYNSDSYSYIVISSVSTGEPLIIVNKSYITAYMGGDMGCFEDMWYHNDKGECVGFSGDSNDDPWLKLPPSLWQKLHTWIVLCRFESLKTPVFSEESLSRWNGFSVDI